jgi:hypothetical protein
LQTEFQVSRSGHFEGSGAQSEAGWRSGIIPRIGGGAAAIPVDRRFDASTQ